MEAESPGEGQGTTITLRLPLKASPQELTPPSPAERLHCRIPPRYKPEATAEVIDCRIPSLDGLQLLVVDDEADTRGAGTSRKLRHRGFQLPASAREAIAALTENPGRYDVLISDIGMPDENGYFLIRQVPTLAAEVGGKIPPAGADCVCERSRTRKGDRSWFSNRHLLSRSSQFN